MCAWEKRCSLAKCCAKHAEGLVNRRRGELFCLDLRKPSFNRLRGEAEERDTSEIGHDMLADTVAIDAPSGGPNSALGRLEPFRQEFPDANPGGRDSCPNLSLG